MAIAEAGKKKRPKKTCNKAEVKSDLLKTNEDIIFANFRNFTKVCNGCATLLRNTFAQFKCITFKLDQFTNFS